MFYGVYIVIRILVLNVGKVAKALSIGLSYLALKFAGPWREQSLDSDFLNPICFARECCPERASQLFHETTKKSA